MMKSKKQQLVSREMRAHLQPERRRSVPLFHGVPNAASRAVRTVGEAEAIFASLRPTANAIDDNQPYEDQKDGTSSYTVETTYRLI